MTIENTLILIKPDAFNRKLVGKILQRFEEKGFDIKQLKTHNFKTDTAKEFYSVHSNKPFF
jgi:nucleoside-diphosphate kinase